MRHPVLRYTVLRLVLLVAAAAVLYAVGARGVLLVVLAVLVSGLASLPLLSRQRDAVSARLVQRSQRARRRLDEGAATEDD